ncbi:MAG: CDP-archaeol synthase [Methylomicrobium sp.]
MEDILSLSGIFNALVLLLAANGAPVLVGALAGSYAARPIDSGIRLGDGHPLFGTAKTWRGLLAALAVTPVMAYLLGYGLLTGVFFALGTMIGDILASFCKRRLHITEGSHVRGVDTVPESLFPLLMLKSELGIGWLEIAILVGAFYLIEEWLSPVLYKWRLRNHP